MGRDPEGAGRLWATAREGRELRAAAFGHVPLRLIRRPPRATIEPARSLTRARLRSSGSSLDSKWQKSAGPGRGATSVPGVGSVLPRLGVAAGGLLSDQNLSSMRAHFRARSYASITSEPRSSTTFPGAQRAPAPAAFGSNVGSSLIAGLNSPFSSQLAAHRRSALRLRRFRRRMVQI